MNNAVFIKTMETVGKHRDIKLVTTLKGRNYLVSEPNYHLTNIFLKNYQQKKLKYTQKNCLFLVVSTGTE